MIVIPQQWFQYTNILLIVWLLLFFVLGYSKGFFRQIVSLFGSVVAIFVAIRFSSVLEKFFPIWPKSLAPLQDTLMADIVYHYINQLFWFILLFIVANIIFRILEKMLDGVHNVPVLKQVSQILGGLLGLFSGLIWVLVITTLLSMPIFKNGNQVIENSYLSLIRNSVDAGFELIGVNSYRDTVNQIYTTIQSLDDKDQKIVEQWLIDQGFQIQS